MTERNPFFKTIRESAGMRMSVLFGSFFIALIISSFIAIAIDALPGDARTHSLATSVVQAILVFCVPAWLLARFSSDTPSRWLRLDTRIDFRALLGVVIVYLLSLPAMEWLIQWNASLHLPESMSGLEQTLRTWEDRNQMATLTLLDARGWGALISGVLVIGVITGISEELFFRSGVQGIFTRSGVKADLAVWMAAIIFSAMHFQFFGFVPRMIMGAFFGYLLLWTKDVKISAFAHILNNSVVVIVAAFSSPEEIISGESLLVPDVPYLPLASVLSTVMFFIFFRKFFFQKSQNTTVTWPKSQLPPVSGN